MTDQLSLGVHELGRTIRVIDDVGFHAVCQLCDWRTDYWSSRDKAGRASTWHVYRAHRETWITVFGDRPPFDQEPMR